MIEFNNNYLVYPFGLYNNSIICYFNSVLQVLFTCTSMNEYLLNNIEKFENQKFIMLYIKILQTHLNLTEQGNNKLENLNLLLFNEFLNTIKIKFKNNKFGYNQEDCDELLVLILDIINDKYIYNLFTHKYICNIYCKNCKSIQSIQEDKSIKFELDKNAINSNYLSYKIDKNLHNINKYLRNNYSELSNFKCNKCNKQNSIKLNRLLTTPTILMITFNKYLLKENINYPYELYFINKEIKKNYRYKLISTIEHSGTVNYGHYISKCYRKNTINKSTDSKTSVYTLNDQSYELSNFKSHINTYILVYHYVEILDYDE